MTNGMKNSLCNKNNKSWKRKGRDSTKKKNGPWCCDTIFMGRLRKHCVCILPLFWLSCLFHPLSFSFSLSASYFLFLWSSSSVHEFLWFAWCIESMSMCLALHENVCAPIWLAPSSNLNGCMYVRERKWIPFVSRPHDDDGCMSCLWATTHSFSNFWPATTRRTSRPSARRMKPPLLSSVMGKSCKVNQIYAACPCCEVISFFGVCVSFLKSLFVMFLPL